jgi:hypothetical protein
MIMTNFVKSNFEYRNGYLHYNTADGERKFVARFKRGPITKAKFQAALIKYYDVDAYFARLAGPYNAYGHTPFGMMMYDGIICRHYKTREFIIDGKAV